MSSYKDSTKLLEEDGDKGNRSKELKYQINSATVKAVIKPTKASENKNTSSVRYQNIKDNNNKR